MARTWVAQPLRLEQGVPDEGDVDRRRVGLQQRLKCVVALQPRDVRRLKMTPDRYSQVRSRNGSNWLKSATPAPVRAIIIPAPTLNTAWNNSAGITSSQYQVIGSPVASTMAKSTSMDSIVCCSSTTT